MKKFLFLFYLISIAGYAQLVSGELVYKADFLLDKYEEGRSKNNVAGSDGGLENALKNHILKENQALEYIEFVLIFNQNESFFTQKNKSMAVDSGLDFKFVIASLKAEGEYYLNLKENQSIYHSKKLDRNWLVIDQLKEFDWELTSETKVIQGYTCYKAITKYANSSKKSNEVVAWYAPDIPFRFGPIEYSGLPGLILELEQGNYRFYAEKLTFDTKKKNIKPPTKGEKHTRDSYETKIKEINHRLRGGA